MARHNLKCWPDFFEPAYSGNKTFELRLNDRKFKINDEMYLHEYHPVTGDYSGRVLETVITYVSDIRGVGALKPGYVAIAFLPKVWR